MDFQMEPQENLIFLLGSGRRGDHILLTI